MTWIDRQPPEPIPPEECERIATMLENLSLSREVDYAAHALRQAGRQLQAPSAPQIAVGPLDIPEEPQDE